MADNNLTTGKTQLSSQLTASAAQLAGPAAQLASGASAMNVATGFLKDAFMDKLLGPTAAFSGLLVGSLLTIRKIVRETQIIEKGLQSIGRRQSFEGPFETLLKSATLAKQRIKELYDFTKNSPFRFGDVAQANLNLIKLTRGAWAGKEAMTVIGDAAAATGNSMSDLSHIVGRLMNAISQGKPIDRLLFQFQGTGVVTDDLAEKLTHLRATGAGVSEQLAAVQAALAVTAGGMKNAKSMQDLTNKMDEAIEAMQRAFAEPFLESKENSIKATTAAAQAMTPVLAGIASDLAVVGTLWTDFKNGLVNTAAAAPGVAKALSGIWEGLKTGIVVLAATSAAAAAAGAGAMLRFVTSAAAAASSGVKVGQSLVLLTDAKAGLAAAGSALSRVQLLEAASNAASGAALYAKGIALAVHEAAMKKTVGTTGLAAATNYILAASSITVAGAFRLAGMAAGFLARQAKAATLALFTNPLTAIAAAAAVAAVWLYNLNKRLNETARIAREAASQVAAFRQELDRRSDGIKHIDEWGAHLQYLRNQYKELAADIRNFNQEVANGAEKTEAEIAAQGTRMANLKSTRAALENTRTMDTSKLGLSEKERDALIQQEAERRDAENTDFQRNLSAETSPERRAEMQRERAAQLRQRADEAMAAREAAQGFASSPAGKEKERLETAGVLSESNFLDRKQQIEGRTFTARGRMSPKDRAAREAEFKAQKDRDLAALQAEKDAADAVRAEKLRQINLTSADARVRTKQELEDARKAKAPKQELEAKERAFANANALVDGAATAETEARDAATASTQADREVRRDTEDKQAEAQANAQIADALATGNAAKADSLRFDQQQAALALQILRAYEDGDDALARTLETRKRLNEEERAKERRDFAQDRGVDREANAALIGGDKKGAQAIRDAEELRKMREQYATMGMSPEQAKADFEQNILAQAAGKTPSIVTDSRQSVGGGGGAFQGADPILRAQERIARLNERMVDALNRIDGKMEE